MPLTLENQTNIPDNIIEKIIHSANLPNCELLLFINKEESDNLGEFVPKIYLDDAANCALRVKRLRDKRWDIGIVIYKKASDLFVKYPALFAFCLGHELGHAKACLTEDNVHLLYCLLQAYTLKELKIEISELPHEIMFDRFGKYISELATDGPSKLNNEVNDYLENNPKDPNCFKKILSIDSSNDIDKLIPQLINFIKPFKINFINFLDKAYKDHPDWPILKHKEVIIKLLAEK